MRARYRLWVCPEDGCAAIKGSGAGGVCPTHGREWVPVIVRRERDDAPVSDFKVRQMRESLPEALRPLFDMFAGEPKR